MSQPSSCKGRPLIEANCRRLAQPEWRTETGVNRTVQLRFPKPLTKLKLRGEAIIMQGSKFVSPVHHAIFPHSLGEHQAHRVAHICHWAGSSNAYPYRLVCLLPRRPDRTCPGQRAARDPAKPENATPRMVLGVEVR